MCASKCRNCYLLRCSTKHVETVIIPFRIGELTHTGPFQQISSNSGSRNSTLVIKLNLNELPEPTTALKTHKLQVDKKQ